jgi:hypothetical protein
MNFAVQFKNNKKMNRKNTTTDISYYSLSLTRFLRESFPELAGDSKLIAARSEAAAETYEQAVLNGSNPIEAEEQASVVLFQGLDFSKHDLLITILWEEFADIIDPDDAKTFAIDLLPECEAVFSNYPLSADFENEPEWDLLYTELTGTIAIYLDEHELQ